MQRNDEDKEVISLLTPVGCRKPKGKEFVETEYANSISSVSSTKPDVINLVTPAPIKKVRSKEDDDLFNADELDFFKRNEESNKSYSTQSLTPFILNEISPVPEIKQKRLVVSSPKKKTRKRPRTQQNKEHEKLLCRLSSGKLLHQEMFFQEITVSWYLENTNFANLLNARLQEDHWPEFIRSSNQASHIAAFHVSRRILNPFPSDSKAVELSFVFGEAETEALLCAWAGEDFLLALSVDYAFGDNGFSTIGRRLKIDSAYEGKLKVVLLINPYKQLTNLQKKGQGIDRSFFEKSLIDIYFLYGFQVVIVPNIQECIERLFNLAKCIGLRKYEEVAHYPPNPNLEFIIRKYRTKVYEAPEDSFVSSWIDVLRCFEGISEKSARFVAREYPSYKSLMQKYESLTATDGEELLHKLIEKQTGNKKTRKVSKNIYNYFMSSLSS
eukprot:maker-scaffold_42-snap-gene-1.1-mRNA-1 protein AED:0.00 eAED:0.00 QI:98/1/1/1/1/1/2/66/440